MNTTKKIAVVLAVMMVAAAMAAPAAMGVPTDYTATVSSSQNTALTYSDGAFGSITAGNSDTIAESIKLKNIGNVNATVGAAGGPFTNTSTSATFGISNLSINGVALNGTVINNVPCNASNCTYSATLSIPNMQTAGDYSTTVTLTFG